MVKKAFCMKVYPEKQEEYKKRHEDEKLWEKMANTSINQKWWKYMEDIMETNPDASPVSWELMPVFEL